MIIQLIGRDVKVRTELALYLTKKLDAILINDTDIPMAANHDQWSRWLRSLATIIVSQKNIPVIVSGTFPTQTSRQQFKENISGIKVPDVAIFIDTDSKDRIRFDEEWEPIDSSWYNIKVNSLDSMIDIDNLISSIV